ncbi:hypothetical protein Tco_1178806, partial [Tanacetum coccineum]
NGSLFEGESEFEKLKIYLITLVSIRSDWEDLPWLLRSVENLNTMAEQNVPAQAPTRTDEQIISVDILRNTNFFRAFSASASVPAIYIQQFWNSMKYDEKTGVYCCQVDEQWFNLSVDLLRKALDITPVDPAHPFELPPTGDTVIDFVNELGYPEPVEFVSNIRVNYVYQPWRAILTMINQCLTGKTSGIDKPIEDDQEKFKVIDESDSTIPDPSHQAVTSTPLVIALATDFSSPKPSSLVTPPPINTEATTITTSLPKITPFIALQLRVARLEQEIYEVKKTDHSADVLASIKSQVPTVVDKYLGTKLDDALFKS